MQWRGGCWWFGVPNRCGVFNTILQVLIVCASIDFMIPIELLKISNITNLSPGKKMSALFGLLFTSMPVRGCHDLRALLAFIQQLIGMVCDCLQARQLYISRIDSLPNMICDMSQCLQALLFMHVAAVCYELGVAAVTELQLLSGGKHPELQGSAQVAQKKNQ